MHVCVCGFGEGGVRGGTSLADGNLPSARFHTRWGCVAFWSTLNMQIGRLYVCHQEASKLNPQGTQLIGISVFSVWTGDGSVGVAAQRLTNVKKN